MLKTKLPSGVLLGSEDSALQKRASLRLLQLLLMALERTTSFPRARVSHHGSKETRDGGHSLFESEVVRSGAIRNRPDTPEEE